MSESETTFFGSLQRRVLDKIRTWGPWPRAAWCRKQRRVLGASNGAVVWVRGQADWAAWGARHGYFEVQLMDGLPYLRAAAPRSA